LLKERNIQAKALSRSVLDLLTRVLLIVGQEPVSARQETAAPGQSLKPLESLLQADGTL
jgi:hypothetical protein